MACEAVQIGLGKGNWEGRASTVCHQTRNSTHRSRRDGESSLALPSRFLGVKLASSCPRRSSYNVSASSTDGFKVECRTAEPDHDLSSSDEYWSAIAAQYQKPMFDICEQVTIPERVSATATSERSRWSGALMIPVQEQSQVDWRSFRAKLCSTESATWKESKSSTNSKQWAHRLSTPEVGCVLVSTDKLNHHGFLRGAVILITAISHTECHGIVLNKKMPFCAHNRQGADQRILLGLSGCPKYVGGPMLSTPKINVLSGRTDIRGFGTLMPGLAVGGNAALPTLVRAVGSGVIPTGEVNVYIGEVEWDFTHLMAEIDVFEWWDVAACSSGTLLESSTGDLRQNLRSLLLL